MASSIHYSVSEGVAIVLDEILPRIDSIKNPAFDVREQILADADVLLQIYRGRWQGYISGAILTISGSGQQTHADLVPKGHLDGPLTHLLPHSFYMVEGPRRGSDIDALMALHEKMKLALERARLLSTTCGLTDFAHLFNHGEMA